jgi:hypothetical protein
MGRRHRHLNPRAAGGVLYLDARRIQGVADNTEISAWSNLGTGGGSTSQSTSADRPRYRSASGPNGLPCVAFDGSTEYLRMDIATGSVAYLGLVGSMTSIGGAYAAFMSLRSINATLVPNGVAGVLLTSEGSSASRLNEFGVATTSCTYNGGTASVADLTGYLVGLTVTSPFVFSESFPGLGSGTGYCCIGRDSYQLDSTPRAINGYVSRLILGLSMGAGMVKRLDHSSGYSFKIACS